MSETDPRTYRPQDRLLYVLMALWIIAWASDLILSPFDHPGMPILMPACLGTIIIGVQIAVPGLRFSGLANMIGLIILGSTAGLGLICRAV